ncbi:MAG: DUF3592 domain-containing protein [Anaerolineae bacterium]|nr:DUF3592 domain-containing protein [Anaerolineae bacterium]
MLGDLFPLIFALFCGGIFIVALAALGIFLIAFSLRSRKKAAASQSWPATFGQITKAEVKQSASTDDDGRTTYAYYPAVEYTYQIGGQTYTSKRMSFGGVVAYGSWAKAEAGLARFPVGSQVTVYYNPEKPAEAVLEQKAGGFAWGMIVGAVCLALGACIACPLLIGIATNLLSAK